MLDHKARSVTGSILSTLLILVLSASVVDAKLTTPTCLAQKRKAWGDLRKCQATEAVKALKGKDADPAKCHTRFEAALAKIDVKATKAGIQCRFGDNGDQTITDYDSGLQWEKKSGFVGGLCLPNNIHCIHDVYTWADSHFFIGRLNGPINGGGPAFAGFDDWRLPTLDELQFIAPSVATLAAIWGSNAPDFYWSGTTSGTMGAASTALLLEPLTILSISLPDPYHVRAVRTAF